MKLYARGTITILTDIPKEPLSERPLDIELERPSDKELERRSETLYFFEAKGRDISVWCEATNKHSVIKQRK